MIADDETRSAVRALIDDTFRVMSTPGSDVAAVFGREHIAIAGSGQGELWSGPDQVVGAAAVVSSWGFEWRVENVTVWRRGEVAWAQILGSVHVQRDSSDEWVPYWTTGVFTLDDGRWSWAYWGGSEPQEDAKV